MANMLENIGLDFMREKEETITGLLSYVAKEGKALVGYSGDPYLYKSTGTSELWETLRTDEKEEKYYFDRLHTHGTNACLFEFEHTGIDITPKDVSHSEHIGMFNYPSGNVGMIPIDIINADVLPSFMKGDKYSLQLVAFPLEINYYKDEDEQAKTLPKDKHGKKWGIGLGAMFPLSFMANHCNGSDEKDENFDTDKYIHFSARVKELYHGTLEMGDNKYNAYIRCIAETCLGDLEFAHHIELVPEELRCNIKPGAIIDGVCLLSGDAAVNEYKDGAIFDLEHDLKLIRYVLSEGKFDKLKVALNENMVYTSKSRNKKIVGRDEFIKDFKRIYHNQKDSNTKCYINTATITEADEGLKYPVGTKCLSFAYDEEDNYKNLLFITLDEKGNIDCLDMSNESGYKFMIEKEECYEPDFDDAKLPDTIVDAILTRASVLMSMIDEDVDGKEFINGIEDYSVFEGRAEQFLCDMQENKQDDLETALENSIGYLFVKAIEYEYNKRNNNEKSLVSFRPSDAYKGIIKSSLNEKLTRGLKEAMEDGKLFFIDFKTYLIMGENEDLFEKLYTDTAIAVQRLGQLYVDKFINLYE